MNELVNEKSIIKEENLSRNKNNRKNNSFKWILLVNRIFVINDIEL